MALCLLLLGMRDLETPYAAILSWQKLDLDFPRALRVLVFEPCVLVANSQGNASDRSRKLPQMEHEERIKGK